MKHITFAIMVVLIFGVAISPVLQNGFVYAQTSEESDYTNSNGEESEDKNSTVCVMVYAPVCSVDGKTFSNLCMLEASDTKLDHDGECVIAQPDLEFPIVRNPNDKQTQHIEDKKQKLQIKLDAMKEKRSEVYEKRKAQFMEKFSNMSEDKKQKLQTKLDAMKEKLHAKLDLNRDANSINRDVVYKLESVCQSSEDVQNMFYSTHAEYDRELLVSICAINDKNIRITKLSESIDEIFRKYVTNTPQGFTDMTIEERQLEIQKIRDERKVERESRQNMTIEERQTYRDYLREKIQEQRESHVSPFGQMSLGLDPTDIMCSEGKELVIKVSNGMPRCLVYDTAITLIDRGIVTYPQ